jgi:GT2 family glycosyltransferase
VPGVTAVVPTFAARPELRVVLDALAESPVDEVIVVENAPNPELEDRPEVRILQPGRNLGIAARNLAAREATGDLLLMLDDDSYPLPGAVETLVEAFERDERLGVAGGLVRDVDPKTGAENERGTNTFDYWLGDPSRPDAEVPAFFFPEGACMMRREAFLEVGGYFEPFFQSGAGLDLATVLLAQGWDVRYVPTARFVHLKADSGRSKSVMLRARIRNQLWYFYRHFPARTAACRIPAYLAFDLAESVKSGATGSWGRGIYDAWHDRASVRGTREPLPRDVIRRAELNRGRRHLRLLSDRAGRLASQLRLRKT